MIVFHPADEVDTELPFVTPVVMDDHTKEYKSSTATDSLELTFRKKIAAMAVAMKHIPVK